ncbi:hypothetical protein FN846DRAFT_889441 [Sphaerosporella brunnea]|uniref:Uncharacterized protein n=1 Tax=Sphaerosporella brunnea TaxID=1250544 RepID=A0A5J5EZK7_9PEZI|nr:hypothetical protein FN846DRAFT_889441 [Sphaerosporella brunnea]
MWKMPGHMVDQVLDGVEVVVRVRAYILEVMMSYHDEEHVLYLVGKLIARTSVPRLFPQPATNGLWHPSSTTWQTPGSLRRQLLSSPPSTTAAAGCTRSIPPTVRGPWFTLSPHCDIYNAGCPKASACPHGTAAALRQAGSALLADGADPEAVVVFHNNPSSQHEYWGSVDSRMTVAHLAADAGC